MWMSIKVRRLCNAAIVLSLSIKLAENLWTMRFVALLTLDKTLLLDC
jgi:hypothetical protein